MVASTAGSLNAAALIDDSEATNWAGVTTGTSVDASHPSVTVQLAGPGTKTVHRVQVSAMLNPPPPGPLDDVPLLVGQDDDPDSGSRFTALRKFAIETCATACTSAGSWKRIFTSADNAFPSVMPRPVAPDLTLRSFDVPDTRRRTCGSWSSRTSAPAPRPTRASRTTTRPTTPTARPPPTATSWSTPPSCRSSDAACRRGRRVHGKRGPQPISWRSAESRVSTGVRVPGRDRLRSAACICVTSRIRKCEAMVGRIPVFDVAPVVNLGRNPAKATVGEEFDVTATVFREGHDQLGAEVVLTDADGVRRDPVRMHEIADQPLRMTATGPHRRPRAVDLRDPDLERHDRHLAARRRRSRSAPASTSS